jgi:deoxycytidylate deaminase
MNINKYLAFAKSVSQSSDFCENKTSRHTGCVIIHKNRVISVGCNTSKEHPLQKKYNKRRGFNTDICKNSLHAEMYALIKADGIDVDWSKVTVFVYRELANGKCALARPCRACMKAIIDRGIKHICYTTDTGYIREVVY